MFKAFCFLLTVVVSVPRSVSPALSLTSPKGWWIKRISEDLYTGGWPSERLLKYAADIGVRTVVSMLNVSEAPDLWGDEQLPGTDRAEYVATQLAGMDYSTVMQRGESDPYNLEMIKRFTAIMNATRLPVLLHCTHARDSTFTAFAYLANVSSHDPQATPKMNSEEFYGKTAALGFYYNQTIQKQLVSTITGEPIVADPPKPDISLPEWDATYWLLDPIYKNWYTTGQMTEQQLHKLSLDFDVIVNARLGVTSPKGQAPSQEEVTLLNIRDNTGTYEGTGRQSEDRLLKNRLHTEAPNEYIDDQATKNYESRNFCEFGDEIGYNETLEQMKVKGKTLGYVHTPLETQGGFTVEMWENYKDGLLEAGQHSAVLTHCRTGYRGAILALLAAGYQYDKDSEWALERGRDIGIDYGTNAPVVQLFRDVLDNRVSSDSNNTSPIVAFCVCIIFGFLINLAV